jgi:hypothetical protein
MPQQHDSFQYMPRQSHPESTDFHEFKNRAVNYRESTRIIQSRFDIDQDYAIFQFTFSSSTLYKFDNHATGF